MTAISRPVLMLAMPPSYGIPLWSDRTHDTRISPLYKALFPSVAVAFNEPRGTYISVSLRVPFVPVRRNDGSAVLIATPFDFDLATFTGKLRMPILFSNLSYFQSHTRLLFILFNNLFTLLHWYRISKTSIVQNFSKSVLLSENFASTLWKCFQESWNYNKFDKL